MERQGRKWAAAAAAAGRRQRVLFRAAFHWHFSSLRRSSAALCPCIQLVQMVKIPAPPKMRNIPCRLLRPNKKPRPPATPKPPCIYRWRGNRRCSSYRRALRPTCFRYECKKCKPELNMCHACWSTPSSHLCRPGHAAWHKFERCTDSKRVAQECPKHDAEFVAETKACKLAAAGASDPQTTQKSKKQRPRRLRQLVLLPINAFMLERLVTIASSRISPACAIAAPNALTLTSVTLPSTSMRTLTLSPASCTSPLPLSTPTCSAAAASRSRWPARATSAHHAHPRSTCATPAGLRLQRTPASRATLHATAS